MEKRIPIPDTFTVAHLDELRKRLPDVPINCTNGYILIDAQYTAVAMDILCELLPVVQQVEYHVPKPAKPEHPVRHHRTVRNAGPDWVLSL